MSSLARYLIVAALWLAGVTGALAGYRGEICSGETHTGLRLSGPWFRDSWTFAGAAGERVIIIATETSTGLDTFLDLYAPGASVREADTRPGGNRLDHQLRATGIYTVYVRDDGGDAGGTYNISFLKISGAVGFPGDEDGGSIFSGQTLAGAVSTVSDLDAFRFYGKAGERVLINAVETCAGVDTYIDLYPPAGDPREATTLPTGNRLDHALQRTGVYTIVIQDNGLDDAGSYRITLVKLPGTISAPGDCDGGMLLAGQSMTGTIDAPSDMDVFQFYGRAGEQVLLTVTVHSGSLDTSLALYPPDSGPAEADTYGGDQLDHRLLQTGLYSVIVQDAGLRETGRYTIALEKEPPVGPEGIYHPEPEPCVTLVHLQGFFIWDPVPGVTGYDLYCWDDPLTPPVRRAVNRPAPGVYLPVLVRERVYYWYVVAHTPGGDIQSPYWWFRAGRGCPDAQITRSPEEDFCGDDIYGDLYAQTVGRRVDAGVKAVYYIRVENDAAGTDCFRIRCSAGEEKKAADGVAVACFSEPSGGEDITEMAMGAGWISPPLAPGESRIMRVEVTLPADMPGGTENPVVVAVMSMGEPAVTDVVRAITVKVPVHTVTLSAQPHSPVAVNQPVTLTAEVRGGGPVEYEFRAGCYANGALTWTIIQNFGPSATCIWKPTTAQTCYLVASAREAGGTLPCQAVSRPLRYQVYTPLSGVTVTASPSVPCLVGSPITLLATATGGLRVNYLFRAGYKAGDDWRWSLIRGYNTSGTCIWRPSAAHRYVVAAWACDFGVPRSQPCYALVSCTIVNPLTGVTLQASPAPPCMVDTPIQLTARASGGMQVEYKFRAGYCSGQQWQWTVLRDYSSGGSFTWQPSAPGAYMLTVWARETGSARLYEKTAFLRCEVYRPLSGVTMTVSPSAPCLVGTPITLQAVATGGLRVNYLFRAGYKAGDDWVWTVIRGFNTSGTCIWRPSAAHRYVVMVRACDFGVPQSPSSYAQAYCTVVNPLTEVTLQASPVPPCMVDTPIQLTAHATGGMQVEYQFRAGYLSGLQWQWAVLHSYNSAGSFTWQPSTPGAYILAVWARETGSARLYEQAASLRCEVYRPLSGVTLSTSALPPQGVGTQIILTAYPENGYRVTYEFRVGFLENGIVTWSVLRPYAASPTCEWTPTAPGQYYLAVRAREAGNTQPYQYYHSVPFRVSE